MDPKQLLFEYGPQYFAYVVFFCALLESDITFLMAGIYAASMRKAHLNPWIAVAAGIAGALTQDTFWFFVARHRAAWIKETRAWKRFGPQIEHWAGRFGVGELALARLIPGTRAPSMFFWGIQHLRVPTFFAVNVAALTVWGTAITFLGYFFGKQAEFVLGKIKQKNLGKHLLIALLITVLIYVAIRLFTRHEIKVHGKPPEDPRAD